MSCTNETPCFKPVLRWVHSERCRAGSDPARLRARVEELEGAMRSISCTPCDESVHAACCGRRHRETARRVLGEAGKDGG